MPSAQPQTLPTAPKVSVTLTLPSNNCLKLKFYNLEQLTHELS